MRRGAACVLGVWMAGALLATPATAQVRVDVGILVPIAGARVVVGAPRTHDVIRPHEPVYIPYDARWRRAHPREWAKRDHEYYKDMLKARREYEKDRRKAEREYVKDLRKAQKEYEKDRREARRDRRW